VPAKYFRGKKRSGFFLFAQEKIRVTLEKSRTRFSNFFALYTTSGSSIDQHKENVWGNTMTAANTTATGNAMQAIQKIPLAIHIAGILLLVAVTIWCGPVASSLL